MLRFNLIDRQNNPFVLEVDLRQDVSADVIFRFKGRDINGLEELDKNFIRACLQASVDTGVNSAEELSNLTRNMLDQTYDFNDRRYLGFWGCRQYAFYTRERTQSVFECRIPLPQTLLAFFREYTNYTPVQIERYRREILHYLRGFEYADDLPSGVDLIEPPQVINPEERAPAFLANPRAQVEPTQGTDYSFLFNCLAGAALGSGIIMLVVGIIAAQPILIGVGAATAGLGLIALGLFATNCIKPGEVVQSDYSLNH